MNTLLVNPDLAEKLKKTTRRKANKTDKIPAAIPSAVKTAETAETEMKMELLRSQNQAWTGDFGHKTAAPETYVNKPRGHSSHRIHAVKGWFVRFRQQQSSVSSGFSNIRCTTHEAKPDHRIPNASSSLYNEQQRYVRVPLTQYFRVHLWPS